MNNKTHNHGHKAHHNHHQMMIKDFRKRFIVSIIFTIPVLILSPMIADFLGIGKAVLFNGYNYVLFAVSTFIFIYGGFPFLKGLYTELKSRQPGMMTLHRAGNHYGLRLQQRSRVRT